MVKADLAIVFMYESEPHLMTEKRGYDLEILSFPIKPK